MADITMVRGETLDLKIEVVDGDGKNVPLAGFTIIWRTSGGLERSTAKGTITVTGNVATLRLAPADTRALPNRNAQQAYEVKAKAPNAVVKQIVAGAFIIKDTLIDEVA